MPEGTEVLLRHMAAAAVFAIMGIAILAGAIRVFAKVAPFSVQKEIAEDQNTALAIVMGSFILGISIIIAASVTG
jgi:putative membrane protein